MKLYMVMSPPGKECDQKVKPGLIVPPDLQDIFFLYGKII